MGCPYLSTDRRGGPARGDRRRPRPARADACCRRRLLRPDLPRLRPVADTGKPGLADGPGVRRVRPCHRAGDRLPRGPVPATARGGLADRSAAAVGGSRGRGVRPRGRGQPEQPHRPPHAGRRAARGDRRRARPDPLVDRRGVPRVRRSRRVARPVRRDRSAGSGLHLDVEDVRPVRRPGRLPGCRAGDSGGATPVDAAVGSRAAGPARRCGGPARPGLLHRPAAAHTGFAESSPRIWPGWTRPSWSRSRWRTSFR